MPKSDTWANEPSTKGDPTARVTTIKELNAVPKAKPKQVKLELPYQVSGVIKFVPIDVDSMLCLLVECHGMKMFWPKEGGKNYHPVWSPIVDNEIDITNAFLALPTLSMLHALRLVFGDLKDSKKFEAARSLELGDDSAVPDLTGSERERFKAFLVEHCTKYVEPIYKEWVKTQEAKDKRLELRRKEQLNTYVDALRREGYTVTAPKPTATTQKGK